MDAPLRCELCNESATCHLACLEHELSLRHHVRMEQLDRSLTHECVLCGFFSLILSEYSKHIDSTEHREKLAELRKRIAVNEDVGISDSFSVSSAAPSESETDCPRSSSEKCQAESQFMKGVESYCEFRQKSCRVPLLRTPSPVQNFIYFDEDDVYGSSHANEMWDFRYARPLQAPDTEFRKSGNRRGGGQGRFKQKSFRGSQRSNLSKSDRQRGKRWNGKRGESAARSKPRNSFCNREQQCDSFDSEKRFHSGKVREDGPLPGESQQSNECTAVASSPKRKVTCEKTRKRRMCMSESEIPSSSSDVASGGKSEVGESKSGGEAVSLNEKKESKKGASVATFRSPLGSPTLPSSTSHSGSLPQSALPPSQAHLDKTKKYEKIALRSFAAYSQNVSSRMFRSRQMKYQLVRRHLADADTVPSVHGVDEIPSSSVSFVARNTDIGDCASSERGDSCPSTCSEPITVCVNTPDQSPCKNEPYVLQVDPSLLLLSGTCANADVSKESTDLPVSVVEDEPTSSALKTVKCEPDMDANDMETSEDGPALSILAEPLKNMWKMVALESELQARRAFVVAELNLIDNKIALLQMRRKMLLDEAGGECSSVGTTSS